jgi:hypothetical protein
LATKLAATEEVAMRRVMVSYRVSPDRAENEAAELGEVGSFRLFGAAEGLGTT